MKLHLLISFMKSFLYKNSLDIFLLLLFFILFVPAGYAQIFYGMTSKGGIHGKGAIIKYDNSTSTSTVLFSFENTNGEKPTGDMTVYNGKYYGMTSQGGSDGKGVLFEYDVVTNVYTIGKHFTDASGYTPKGSLTLYNGLFYGMTSRKGGGGVEGTLFSWNPITSTFTSLHNFENATGDEPEGSVVVKDNKLYGMTSKGGLGEGVIFEYDLSLLPATAYTVKVHFDYGIIYAKKPLGSLTFYDGKFYGMTSDSGSGTKGQLFEWDPNSNTYVPLHDFLQGEPAGNVIEYNGNLYGMTLKGGTEGKGIIFEYEIATSNFNSLHSFGSIADDGEEPLGSLTLYNEKLYGMTSKGGSDDEGSIFEYDITTSGYLKKVDFNVTNGANPEGSFTFSLPDYQIISTGGNLVITDLSGNGETLTMLEVGANTIRFENSNMTRTYRIGGGPVISFSTSTSIDISLIDLITINTEGGNDTINIGAFTTLPSLTINGGIGDDVVNFNGNINFATNASLDVDLQNDATLVGIDQVNIAANRNIQLQGAATATIKASRNITFNPNSSLNTANGNVILEANQQASQTAGNFMGILFKQAKLQTGSGEISLKGRGGNGTLNLNCGIGVEGTSGNNALISSASGKVEIIGLGGKGLAENHGIYVSGNGVANSAVITSGVNGEVVVIGTGGNGIGDRQVGVHISNGGKISNNGTGSVTVNGIGGLHTENFNIGVYIGGTNSFITSGGGAVSVTGTGRGTGASAGNYGVLVGSVTANNATITSGGNGSVTVNGSGGTTIGESQFGVYVWNGGKILSGGTGLVTVNGTGGTSSGNNNYGVNVQNNNSIIGSGSDGNVNVIGIGGGTGGSVNNYGVFISGGTTPNFARITSGGIGTVNVEGTGGNNGGTGNNQVGVSVLSGGRILSGGSGLVTVRGTGGASSGSFNYGVNVGNVSSAINSFISSGSNGNVNVIGLGGGTGGSSDNYGVNIGRSSANYGVVTSGGTGSVTVTGTGGNGTGTGARQVGVQINFGARILSGDLGSVTVDGTGGTSSGDNNVGVYVEDDPSPTPLNTRISSGGGAVSVTGKGGGTGVSEGNHGVWVTKGNARITSGGDGAINVEGTRGTGTNVADVLLENGGQIISTTSSTTGIIVKTNTIGGFSPFAAGVDVITGASQNLKLGGSLNSATLSLRINGTIANTQYEQLNVQGAINLNGATLNTYKTNASFAPAVGQTFVVVNNTSVQTTTGTFSQGVLISDFLSSGLNAQINYTGGDGNDVVLTVVEPNFYSSASGAWSVGTTWSLTSGGTSCACTPTPNSNVFIEAGFTVTTDANNQLDGKSITIGTTSGSGILDLGTTTHGLITELRTTATFAAQAGTIRLSAGNNLTVTTNTFSTNTNSIVEFTGAGYSIPGSFAGTNYPNLVVSGTGTKNLSGNTLIQDNLTLNGAILQLSSFDFKVVGITTISAGAAINDTVAGGVNTFGVIENSGSFTSAASIVHTYVFNGDITNGTPTAASSIFDLLGDVTYSFATPVVITNYNSPMVFSSPNEGKGIVLGNTTINSPSPYSSNVSLNSSVANSVGINTATTNLTNNVEGGASLTITGGLIGTGTFTNNATLKYNAPGAIGVNTFITSISNGTVEYNSAADQIIRDVNYHNLIVSESGNKTLAGNIVVNGGFVIQNNVTFIAGSHTLDLKNGFVKSTGSIFEAGTGTVIISGTSSSQFINGNNGVAINFNDLTINTSFTPGVVISPSTPIIVSGILTLTNGRLLIGDNNLIFNSTIVGSTNARYIVTNGTGNLISGAGGGVFFPIGGLTTYRPVELSTAVINASVRFGDPTISPIPNSGVGSWFINNTNQATDVTISPTVGFINANSKIHKYTASDWSLATPNNYTAPNVYTITNFGFTGTTEEFSIFTPVQEINVQGNGNNIISGTSTTSTANDTDFEDVAECLNSTEITSFTIQNTGTALLNITGIIVSGANATDFVVSSTPIAVAIGGSETFTIAFNPSATGNRTATVTINSDAGNQPTYIFAVSGNGTADNINPIIPTLANATAQCEVIILTTPTTTDNCDGTVTGTTTQTFPITTQGTTTVTWTFTDAAGNSVTADQNVVIDDITNPTIPVLANVTAQCEVTALIAPTTTDNCDGTVTGTTAQTLPITLQGTTIVTWTFTDAAGNSVTANQTIEVSDNIAPVLTSAIPDIVVGSNQGCSFNNATASVPISDVTATDNCGSVFYEYTLTGATNQTVNTLSNQVFNEGTTLITWKAVDGNGNESVNNFIVTVLDNNQAPVLNPLPNFTRNTDPTNCYYTNQTTTTNLHIPNGTATDNCGVASYRYLLSGATSADISSLGTVRFNEGITNVSWTATDNSGNVSVPSQFTVIVVDAQNPTIRAPQDITRTTNLYGCTSTRDSLNMGTPIVTDNCSFRVFNNAPAEFPIGQTTVVWTAVDSAGNSAVDQQIVTIREQPYVSPSDSLILVQIYNQMGGSSWNDRWNLNNPVSTWRGVSVRCGNVASINLSNNNLTETLPFSVLNLGRRTESDFSLNIGGNRLGFESAEDFIGLFSNFTYSPQASIYSALTERVQQGESITFSSETEGDFNRYQWYKNQTPIAGATNPTYTIINAVPSDAGVYICKITNRVATQLTLERRPITLNVAGFVSATDSLALVEIFLQTGGTSTWINPWNLFQPVNSWEGVTLNGDKVIELDLSSRNLTGVLPDVFSADLFSELRYLSFFDNKLEGQIPASIGEATTLVYLDLDKNNFEGALPASFGNLINLESLWLSRNRLTSLPNEIGNLGSLRNLYLNSNDFTSLPETLGNLSELLVLNVSNNQLISLPSSVTNISSLIELYANRNYIEAIPFDIERLSNLVVLEFNTNKLTTLPNGILQLTTLSRLRVAENKLEFDDLLPYASESYSVFDYAPQAPIDAEEDRLVILYSSVSLTIQTQGNGNVYQWLKDATPIATTQNLTINRTTTSDVGLYTAQIINARLPDLTLQRRSIRLNVKCQAGLNFLIQEPTKTIFCENQPFSLKLEIAQEFVDVRELRWRRDGVLIAFAQERTYAVKSAGTYRAEVLTADGCTVISNSVEINVVSQPEIDIELSAEKILTSEISSQQTVMYQWLKDGVVIEEATESTYKPIETGEYSLLVLTETGCSSVSETIIFTLDDVTGIEEPEELRSLALFPNPNNGSFFIDFGTNIPNGEPIFVLIDAIGRKSNLKIEVVSSMRYKTTTNNLTGGMYYLQIQTKDGLVFRKFVIEE